MLQISVTGSAEHLFIIIHQLKAHIRTRKRQPCQKLADITSFSAHGFQEFTACRHVKEQILHNYGSTRTAAACRNLRVFTAVDMHGGGKFLALRTGKQRKVGNRGDTGQGFTAKAQGIQAQQILSLRQLACGMAQHSHFGISFTHAAAIISYSDIFRTAGKNRYFNFIRTGIQCVLNQFLYYGRRLFYNLAGSNLVGGIRIQ